MSDLASNRTPNSLFGSKTPTSSTHTLSQHLSASRMALRNSNVQATTPFMLTKHDEESLPSLPSKNSENERCDIQRTPHFHMITRNAVRNKLNSQPTPSPKGILKNMQVYNPSPTSKSITFGGTYYSPSTSVDSRSDNKTFGQGPSHIDAHGESRTLIDEAVKANNPVKNDQVEGTTKTSSKQNQSVSPGARLGTLKTSGGCSCKEICHPQTCSCVQNELCCMVESNGFPCACSETGCRNEFGRRQYDPLKILSHFQTTMKRVNM